LHLAGCTLETTFNKLIKKLVTHIKDEINLQDKPAFYRLSGDIQGGIWQRKTHWPIMLWTCNHTIKKTQMLKLC